MKPKKKNILKSALDLLIISASVSIALIGEQIRQDFEDQSLLEQRLKNIGQSLKSDSIIIVDFSYKEFNFVIEQLDSASNILQTKIPSSTNFNKRIFKNVLIQPLMDLSNARISSFILTESFNHLDDEELQDFILYYNFMLKDDWDKDKRILDYLSLEIIPSLHSSIQPNGQFSIEMKSSEMFKLQNDLNYLKDHYQNKRDRRLQGYLKWQSRIRLKIQDYIDKK